ncbi:MAG: D-aminoacylase [Gemmatimonadaceae bacterium]
MLSGFLRTLQSATVVLIASLGLSAALSAQGSSVQYDVVIRGGHVVDGTGSPWFAADVGIANGRIAAIGHIPAAAAKRSIDATGLMVAPGFIDMMGQTAVPFLSNPNSAFNLLSQGITTINAGEGESSAPLDGDAAKKAGWSTMRQLFAKLDSAGMPMNMAQTVGHTQLRQIVIGDKDRQATAEELERMRAYMREGMEAGAIGLSTSLIYPPAIYGSESEITELAKVAGASGGAYFTHMRNEGDRLLEAIDEALRIGQAAGTPVHIFHLKAAGQANWGKMDLALARIKAARASGQQVGVDIYPYLNNGLGIRALIHPRHSADGEEALLRKLKDPAVRSDIRKEMETLGGWENWYAHAGKNWDRVIVSGLPAPYQKYSGTSVVEIARAVGKDPWDVFFDIAPSSAAAMPQSMSEANKIKAMREEFTSFDTDAGPLDPGMGLVHPRGYGSFPRLLGRYVRDLGILSVEAMVHRMSAVAANEIMAYDRGRLAPGLAADVVVFDPLTIRDRSTFAEPTIPSEGMRYVLVNGGVVLENGKYTGAKPGRVIRGPGYKATR